MQRGFSIVFVLILVGLFGIIVAGSYYFYNNQRIAAINSFEDCVKKYPIMESFPAQCRTSDGRYFTQQLNQTQTGLSINASPDLDFSVKEATDDGRMYKSYNYTYSFTYPENVEKDFKTGCGGPEIRLNDNKFIVCEYPYGSAANAKSLADMFSQDKVIISSTNVTISDVPGIKQVLKDGTEQLTYFYFDYDYMKNGQPSTVYLRFKGDDMNFQQTILDSFKFLK